MREGRRADRYRLGALRGLGWLPALLLSVPLLSTPSTAAPDAPADSPGEEIRLGIGVQVFEPGRTKEAEDSGLRRSEAHFIPFQLRQTLAASDDWAAVRVIPRGADGMDLILSGTILESRGSELAVRIRVEDSTGRVWIRRRFRQRADVEAYRRGELPFQELHDRIARALLRARNRMRPDKLETIREVTNLRFAADLAPDTFGDYLFTRGRRHRLARLPADGDPMMDRIRRIKQRDDQLMATLDGEYAEFHARMLELYHDWRRSSFQQEMALRAIRREANLVSSQLHAYNEAYLALQQARYDGRYVPEQPSELDKRKIQEARRELGRLQYEAMRHAEALRELASSIERNMAPLVVDLENRTLVLQGTAEAKYAQWRELLDEIFRLELPPEAPPALPRDPS